MTHIHTDFPAFLDSLRVPGSRTALSPSLIADALELPSQDLASLARVHRNTLASAPNSPKLQSAMRDIVRVLSAAYELNGDIDRTLFWFVNHPIPDFGHHTAMQLVEQDKVESVIDYIESLSAGASG